MRAILAAFATIAMVTTATIAAPAQGQGQSQAKKSEAGAHGKAVAKSKDKTKENAASQRSNKGGETRGKARADEVHEVNQKKKQGG